MKKAIVHIGVHKTGTTSIQNWLWENRSCIESQFGWNYPTEFSVDNAHHVVPWSVMPRFETNPISRPHRIRIERLKDRLQCYDNIIMSSEPFCMADDAEVDTIRDIFSGFDTTIVIYVRRQDKLIQSEYVQRIKQEVFPLSEPFSNFASLWRARVPALNFNALYLRWRKRFERVIIRDFDAAVRTGVIRSFLQIIGAEDLGPDQEVPENTSLNFHYIAALREANILEGIFPGTRAELEKKMGHLSFPAGRFSFFKGVGAQRYMDQFSAGNASLAANPETQFGGFDSKFHYIMPHEHVETDVCRYLDWFQRVMARR